MLSMLIAWRCKDRSIESARLCLTLVFRTSEFNSFGFNFNGNTDCELFREVCFTAIKVTVDQKRF